MKAVYPVIFTKTNDKKDTVFIEVPDWNILTEGYGLANAIEMARDAIGLAGIAKEDFQQELPKASDLQDVNIRESNFASEGDSIVSFVDIDFLEYRRKIDTKSVRRNVTLPNWLNREAEKAHINVSKVLQEALIATLNLARD